MVNKVTCMGCLSKWRPIEGKCSHECDKCGATLRSINTVRESNQLLKIDECGACLERFSVAVVPEDSIDKALAIKPVKKKVQIAPVPKVAKSPMASPTDPKRPNL